MCGFVASVSSTAVDERVLVRMRDALVHRGPDEAGVWIGDEGRVGLGHRRLSIIDLAHGQQPMASRDGRFVVAYNGEIYNHIELRRELERIGHSFTTRCDTEVLVAGYAEWGDECLGHFDGMFAFVLWDASERRLFFARDRLGKKPLYHARTRHGYVFASEIKGLLEHPDVPRAVDEQALAHYLSFLVAPPPATLFAGISKLPAGHRGSWSDDHGLETERWWALPDGKPLDIGAEEAAEQVRDLLAAAVEKRMMSDVPFGVYLSGGVDSSANVAFMSRLVDEPVRTFSVAFAGEPTLDELGPAREVARLFGTHHREIVIDDTMVMRSLPALVHHQDEPIGDPVCVPLLHLARLTKHEGVTVVQIGEGSDEIFRGYSVYGRVFGGAMRLERLRRAVPAPLLSLALHAGRPFIGSLGYEFAQQALQRGVGPAHGIGGFAERDKRRLLARANGYEPASDYLHRLVGSGRTVAEVASLSLEHEVKLRLSELLLMRVDKMTMAASVEGRAPFLDHRLVEFAAQLPLHLHWHDGHGKLVLKRALAGIVPDSVLNRRKQGFGSPVWRWQSSLRAIAEQELFRDSVLAYLDRDAMRGLVSQPASTRHGFELWIMLNFALWHRHWIEGDDLREVESVAVAGLAA